MAKKRKKRIDLTLFSKGENEKLDAMSEEQIKERIARAAQKELGEEPVNLDFMDTAYEAYDQDGETLGDAADMLVVDSYWGLSV